MNSTLHRLIEILELKQMDENRFSGEHLDFGLKHVFGGQVASQALKASCLTVPSFSPHSLHGYFLRPGNMDSPLVFSVEVLRDGRSFKTRRVTVSQKNKKIFHLCVSFQKHETGLEHQEAMPDAPLPTKLVPSDLQRKKMVDRVPARFKKLMAMPRPIDYRWTDPSEVGNQSVRQASRSAWFKTVSSLPDDPVLHNCLLVYASDYGILETALLPHGVSYLQESILAASLDHSVWFHRPVRLDGWLLHVMQSPNVSGGRGFAQGRIFDAEGRFIASVAQEGLIRVLR